MSWMPEDIDNPAVAPNKVEDTGYKVSALPEINLFMNGHFIVKHVYTYVPFF